MLVAINFLPSLDINENYWYEWKWDNLMEVLGTNSPIIQSSLMHF